MTNLGNNLAFLGVSEAGIEYWDSMLNSPDAVQDDYLKGSYIDLPRSWFDPGICFFIEKLKIPNAVKQVSYLKILHHCLPDPKNILNWTDINLKLAEIQKFFNISPMFSNVQPRNKTFLKLLVKSEKYSIDEWCNEFYLGHIWALLRHAISKLNPAEEDLLEPGRKYLELIERLSGSVDWSNLKCDEKSGSILVTTHNRFRIELYTKSLMKFQSRLFIINSQTIGTTASRNAQPILMYKAIMGKRIVYTAADGAGGNQNATTQVFGKEFQSASSYSWAAWKSKCRSQIGYLNRSTQGSGLALAAMNLPKATKRDTDFEVFRRKYMNKLGKNIELATVNHPFSFGMVRGSNIAIMSE